MAVPTLPAAPRPIGEEVSREGLEGLDPVHLRELADLVESRGWARAGRISDLYWDRPALGRYRHDHRPPPWPADAPPMPATPKVARAGLIALAGDYRAGARDLGDIEHAAGRLTGIARRSQRPPANLADALAVLMKEA